jgi:fumarate reductase subunit C
MSGRFELWLFALQRLSAMVLAPLVLIHLVTMIYAVQGGLSASEILARTQGNALWATLYVIFIVAVSVHGSIGLRTILREMTPLRGAMASVVAAVFCVAVLVLGYRAVGAIT